MPACGAATAATHNRRVRLGCPTRRLRFGSVAVDQPGGSDRRISLFPAATPSATLSPNARALPTPTNGNIHTIGAATSAAPMPATTGAIGLRAASTYRSRRATKSFACVNPMIAAAVDSANASNPNTNTPSSCCYVLVPWLSTAAVSVGFRSVSHNPVDWISSAGPL